MMFNKAYTKDVIQCITTGGHMPTISFRVSAKDDALIRKYAQLHEMELSDFIRQTVIESIEDEYDAQLFEKVWEEEKDSKRYTMDEVKKALGL